MCEGLFWNGATDRIGSNSNTGQALVALRPLGCAFRYCDPLTGRWIKAGYMATQEDIAANYAEREIIGALEVRSGSGGTFSPYRIDPDAEARRLREPAPQISPHLERPPAVDPAECFLIALFLRRYVTYCARRRRYAQMQGAERL